MKLKNSQERDAEFKRRNAIVKYTNTVELTAIAASIESSPFPVEPLPSLGGERAVG